jgi:hypothetical protein
MVDVRNDAEVSIALDRYRGNASVELGWCWF